MTRSVPLVPIRESVVFPNSDSILSFGREKSIVAVQNAFQSDRVVAIFTQKDSKKEDPQKIDLYDVGTIATVTQMMTHNGEIHALVRGQARVKLVDIIANEPHQVATVEELPEAYGSTPEIMSLANQLQDLFRKAITMGKQAEVMMVMRLISGTAEPVELADQVAQILDVKTEIKQSILEEADLKKRLEKVTELLAKEINNLEMEQTITKKTNKKFEERMKRNMLEEKKKVIEKELGEIGDEDGIGSEEVKEYRQKIKAANMPKPVREKADKELKKLMQTSSYNPESGYIRNYLDWLCDMPWGKLSKNNIPLKKAEKVLNNEHYGIDKAKERILEYLAVLKLKNDNKKSDEAHPIILCFVGPPGVGKTSIGRSIAKAMNRKFVRVSLGGIRDEAEIRGHRRTYVGALPGRIIQGIKEAGTKNPIFMLDEVDKVGNDFRGDPSSALLEALDPEQNKEFSDHYLDVPFDLSQVMFICTANVLDTIPSALRDRMEIITFPGYTEREKFGIAKKFLWSKQLKATGLSEKKITILDDSIIEIIARYTREAGVRSLERNLAGVLRKIAKLIGEGKKYPNKIEVKNVHKFLGPQKFTSQIAEKDDEVGMSTGLTWSAVGGDICFIEVSLMPGKGHLTLTGQLGDVMKESARAAYTWARSHYFLLGLKENFASKIDIHIHVPEGAVPKDGPSAGVAMTTALVSALTGIPVRRDVGMTGEITLRGRVLEIGGLKEKAIAGHRAGLKTIIIPKENKKDLDEMPIEVKKGIKFVLATEAEDVLRVALKNWPPRIKVNPSRKFTPMPAMLLAN